MEYIELFPDLLKNIAYLSPEKTGTSTSRPKLFLTGNMPKYEESLSCYISACQEDPELKSFDSSLHKRTSKLIRSITSRGGKTGTLSIDSLVEVCEFVVELNQDVVKIIIDNESKEDVSKIEDLKSLVDLYSESTTKILNLFNAVEKGVEKADIIQLLIRVAIKESETESLDTDFGGNKKKKYAKTLEKLNKIQAMEDPFGEDFETQYASVYHEQVKLLDKIRELQVIFGKKHKNAKKWRRLVNTVFATAISSLMVLSMLFIVVPHPVGGLVANGLNLLIQSAVTWVSKMLEDYEKASKAKNELLLLTENSTKVNIEAMETVKNLVETLITSISSILNTVEIAMEKREEEAVKFVMQELIRKVEVFAEKIEQVGANVAKCIKVVTSGRVLVLEHRANQL